MKFIEPQNQLSAIKIVDGVCIIYITTIFSLFYNFEWIENTYNIKLPLPYELPIMSFILKQDLVSIVSIVIYNKI